MIFVTVGLRPEGFDRLIKEMDEIAGELDEEVVIQIGNSKYTPKNAVFFRSASPVEMDTFYKKSRIVVSHSGIGSILSTFDNGKPLVLVPRRKKYGECFDDHQLQIAEQLQKDNRAIVVKNIEDLEEAISKVNAASIEHTNREALISNLKAYIGNLEKRI